MCRHASDSDDGLTYEMSDRIPRKDLVVDFPFSTCALIGVQALNRIQLF
jgi:hypothetical protein